MTTNVYDPAAIQHEFTRKALRFFYEDIPKDEYDGSEDDLREYAANINESFGYDLDQRIAAQEAALGSCREAFEGLEAENERLRAAVERLQKECNVMRAVLGDIVTSPEWELTGEQEQ